MKNNYTIKQREEQDSLLKTIHFTLEPLYLSLLLSCIYFYQSLFYTTIPTNFTFRYLTVHHTKFNLKFCNYDLNSPNIKNNKVFLVVLGACKYSACKKKEKITKSDKFSLNGNLPVEILLAIS